MKVLLTNDDGYAAPGLGALEAVAREFASEVWIVAPAVEQSYAGHRVTTRAVLSPVAYGPGAWHVDGTPADCVRVALRALGLEPDLVLSGINQGGNLGIDVYTSGTVAAAREAAALGIPAIAVSQFIHGERTLDWQRTARLAARAVTHLRGNPAGLGAFWNVNLPHPPDGDDAEAVGWQECAVDPNPQDVRFVPAEGGGFRYDGRYRARPRLAGADIDVCFRGMIAISRSTL